MSAKWKSAAPPAFTQCCLPLPPSPATSNVGPGLLASRRVGGLSALTPAARGPRFANIAGGGALNAGRQPVEHRRTDFHAVPLPTPRPRSIGRPSGFSCRAEAKGHRRPGSAATSWPRIISRPWGFSPRDPAGNER
jgi:hypothetical protein